jgi:hypothetical protein
MEKWREGSAINSYSSSFAPSFPSSPDGFFLFLSSYIFLRLKNRGKYGVMRTGLQVYIEEVAETASV